MRKILTFLFAALMSVGMFALTPQPGDEWDDDTKTLTVNSNPGSSAYVWKTEIKHVIISSGVTSIGEQAFAACTCMTSITIPNGLESIGPIAFSGCKGLTSITIPNSVTYIGYDAFMSCTNITDVYCYADPINLSWNEKACDDFIKPQRSYTTRIHVPADYYDGYAVKFVATHVVNATFVGDLPASVFAITANVDPDHAGVYYSTFYHSSAKYALPSGVEAFIVTAVSGEVMQLKKIAVAGQTIPAGAGVILKATSDQITLTLSGSAAESAEGNILLGVDDATAVSGLIEAGHTCYVLSGHSTDNTVTGLGFYSYEGANITAHKAYIDWAGGSGPSYAPRRLRFAFDATTGVENVQGNVQSTKVIENGVLYIIKNGVRYNAQGQMVK